MERLGIKVDSYFASEIEKKPMSIAKYNYPDIIQIGDVTKVHYENGTLHTENGDFYIGKVDLFLGGSPCQDLSVYKFDRGDVKGLEGKKSNLFYHYERLLKEVNPTYFLLENVPMQKEWEDIITNLLKVNSVMINSELVSAALRKRLYWTNIPNVTQPEDKGIMIKDIIVPAEEVPEKYWYNKPFVYNGDDKKVQCTIDIKGHRNMKEVYNIIGKCNTLLCDGDGGNRQKKVYQDGRCRKFMPIEYERMQTLPDNYTKYGEDGKLISDSVRYSAIGNGWTVDTIVHILKGLKEEPNTLTFDIINDYINQEDQENTYPNINDLHKHA